MSSTGETILIRLRIHSKVLLPPTLVQLLLLLAHDALFHL